MSDRTTTPWSGENGVYDFADPSNQGMGWPGAEALITWDDQLASTFPADDRPSSQKPFVLDSDPTHCFWERGGNSEVVEASCTAFRSGVQPLLLPLPQSTTSSPRDRSYTAPPNSGGEDPSA